MLDNFSCNAQRAIIASEELAHEFHHPTVGSEHLLLSLLAQEDILVTKELRMQGIKYKTFFDKIKHLYEREKKKYDVVYSLEFQDIIQESIKFGNKNKEGLISVDTLSLTLLTLNNTAKEILEQNKVNIDIIIKKLLMTYKKKSDLLSINDLHLMGANNKDPLIGRENEIIQLIYSLSRRNKPNAILVGEPGVGKTAIVEELAKRLTKNQVPLLKNKVIYELDLASTVGGTKYRGEFEDKLKKIIKKVKEDGNAILFIDEIHNVIKAGGAEGAIDASNILKPYLARGEIQIIGATTLEEFNQSFDKDKALKRRFQIIDVNESTKEETLDILKKIKGIYEDFYSISIDSNLLEEIVDYAEKYLINQRFPDKAIELLDNSCVIAKQKLTIENIIITMNKLYGVIINDDEKISNFEKEFSSKIIGQSSTKKQLIRVMKTNKINSLLFVGKEGCGKAKVAEIIAKTMFFNNFCTIKMEQYSDITGLNRLINNGYNAFGEQTSILVKTLKEKPNSVIFIEGMDNANKEIKSFFQDVLEKGYFIDSKSNKINSKNALFIFSLNTKKKEEFFTLTKPKNIENNSHNVFLEEVLGTKLLNLIDEIISFEEMSKDNIKELITRYIKENGQNIAFELSNITDLELEDISSKGGDLAIKKAKEIIKSKKIKNI